MTLRFRLILVFIISSISTVTVTLILGGGIVYQEIVSGIDFLLDAEAVEITTMLNGSGAHLNKNLVDKAIHEHAQIDASLFYFSVHEPNGQQIYRSPNLEELGLVLPDLGTGIKKSTIQLASIGPVRVAEYPIGDVHVQIASAMKQLELIEGKFYKSLALTIPVVFLTIVFLSLGASRLVLRPIQAIRDTAIRINAHNLNERIPETTENDDLNSLIILLNAMFDRLEKSFRQVRQFSADTSHELRTPLSLLRLHAEKLQDADNLPMDLRENAQELVIEVKQMSEVVNRLLMLSKVDAGIYERNRQPLEIRPFIEEIYDDATALAASKGVSVQLARNDSGCLETDPSCIKQVFFNLLSNVFVHGPKRAVITITSQLEDGHWSIKVRDNGKGVPDSQLDHVFERFARMPRPNDQHIGAGLGLAICKGLANLLGGIITAKNLPNQSGFEVTLTIPTSKSKTDLNCYGN